MIEDMTVRNLSPTTRDAYIHNVKKFSRYFGRSPDCLGLEDVRTYQVHLVSQGIAWATLNQVVSALRFFFGVTLGRKDLPERIAYAPRPKTLPVVLSPEEVAAFLEAVPSRRDRVALTTAYATGLRASEVTGLRICDIDSSRMVIHVVNGKGGKQRTVMLSPKLLGILRAYWAIERPAAPGCFQGALLGHSHLSTTIRYISVATRAIAAVKSPLEHLNLALRDMRPQEECRLTRLVMPAAAFD